MLTAIQATRIAPIGGRRMALPKLGLSALALAVLASTGIPRAEADEPGADSARSAAQSSVAAPSAAEGGANASAPAQSQAPASVPCLFCRRYGPVLARDTRAVFTAPARWDKPAWKSAGYKTLIVAGSMALLDGSVHRYVDAHHTDTKARLADAFEPFGERYGAGVLAAYWIAGTLAHRPAAKATAVDGVTSAIIASGLIVPALKEITGRSRPRTELGTFDFHPFSGSASFPSGHTAAAFSIAGSIAQHTDRKWVKGLAYGVASMVGYARIEHDAHFLSDVTAGAMIGVGVAKYVSKLDAAERPRRVAIEPSRDPYSLAPELTVAVRMR